MVDPALRHARPRGVRKEVFGLIFLDARHRYLGHQQLFHGDVQGASVHPRQVARSVFEYNAAACIALHCHPSQIAEPSHADELITQRLKETLGHLEVRLLDHLLGGWQPSDFLRATRPHVNERWRDCRRASYAQEGEAGLLNSQPNTPFAPSMASRTLALFPTEAGTPQGGIASPTIANIALDGLEALLTEHFGSTASSIRQFKVRLVRYADDFIITGTSKELLEDEVKPCVEAFLAARGLELSQEKTKITHISEGFDFLGQNVRKYDDKLLIKPSAKNVKAFLEKVRETVRANRSAKQETLINLLNPMIRGWANYHRHVVAKRTYTAVDNHIWQTLWRWARRRHPNKSCGWVQRKYFRTLGHRHGLFAAAIRGYNDEPRILVLLSASDTRIVRHVGVKSDANPFDPVWDTYFATRQRSRMLQRLQDRSFPKQLWQQQEGKCPVCGQLIDDEAPWLIRPVVPIKAGGTRSLANLRMLHSTCQRQFRIANGKCSASDTRVPAP